MISSIRYLGPLIPCRTVSSDLSASALSRSRTWLAAIPDPAQTCSAASRVAPPAKSENRRQTARSGASSRSQLQSTTARSVWCRGIATRLPPVSRPNRSSSRAATCSGAMVRSRAAASGGRDIGRVGDRGQLHQPHPAWGGGQLGPGRLDGQPGLARAARAGQREQAVRPEQPGDLGEFGVTADEAGQLRAQVGVRRWFRRFPQELQVQSRQFGGGIRAQLIGQAFPGLLVDLQGSAAPPGRVQGAHQPGGQRLGAGASGPVPRLRPPAAR